MLKFSPQSQLSRLPDQVTLRHGPVELLGRYLLSLDRAVRERGVYLSLSSDLNDLLTVKKQYPSLQLPPIFNPEVARTNHTNSFCLIGFNQEGEIVATQAARAINLNGKSLAQNFESLEIFYPNPSTQAWPGEYCRVTAKSAAKIKGSITYSGNTWARPDFRGRDLGSLLPRISRALALSLWNCKYTISMVQTALVDKGMATKYGYSNIEGHVTWNRVEIDQMLKFCLVWMPRTECISDIRKFHSSISVQQPMATAQLVVQRDSDVGIEERCTRQ